MNTEAPVPRGEFEEFRYNVREDLQEVKVTLKEFPPMFKGMLDTALVPLTAEIRLQNGRVTTLERLAATRETQLKGAKWAIGVLWVILSGTWASDIIKFFQR